MVLGRFWAKGQRVGKPDRAVTLELLALTTKKFGFI
jgi:hypothetical protein